MPGRHTKDDLTTASGDVRTDISDGIVALLKEFYGRGPEKTKTYVNAAP